MSVTVLSRNSEWSPLEQRSTVYFQEIAVYKILTLRRDSHFWKQVVPCSAETYTPIRHLVVAIAATYELLFSPDFDALNQFALEQCNKALRSILTSNDLSQSVLITSCILVSAYNLLRGDVEAADKSIESGLKMLSAAQITKPDSYLEQSSHILTSLGKQHGFKLWAPDVTFLVDRTVAGHEDMMVDTKFLQGPFVGIGQVLAAFKSIMVENVAQLIRNLSLGAHMDPECMLARDVSLNFSGILFHWETYYRGLSDGQADEKLQLVQLKIGLLSARLLFYTRIIESDEMRGDAFTTVYAEILQLGQEVIAARQAGRAVVYLDRIVNGALYTSAMFCREPLIKAQLIDLLKSQVVYADGLVNFLRGRVAEIVAEIEEHGIVVNHCHDIPENRRVRVGDLHYQQNRILCVEYVQAAQTDRLSMKRHCSRLPPELDRFDAPEIDDCLKGMVSAYTMYRKLELHVAPNGYLRKMYYGGYPVRVIWRADLRGTPDSCGLTYIM